MSLAIWGHIKAVTLKHKPKIYMFVNDLRKIYLFLDRGEGKEKERERNINVWLLLMCPLLGMIWLVTQAGALTGN